jgi:hypothetical protein
MTNQTEKHVYHVFDPDERIDAMDVKQLNILVHGPNITAENFSSNTFNIRKGTKTETLHHCGGPTGHPKTLACFGRDLHQNFCPCWIHKEDVGWYRCGVVTEVTSPGCTKHKNDEMTKVFDKIKKKYPVYGRELNLNLEKTKELVHESMDIQEQDRVATEEAEKQLEETGTIQEETWLYSKLKSQAKVTKLQQIYSRKDNKEDARRNMNKADKENVNENVPQQRKGIGDRIAARLGFPQKKEKEKTRGGTKPKQATDPPNPM